MVSNTTTGKPRGYAFVEFEHERDMHCKYTQWRYIVSTWSSLSTWPVWTVWWHITIAKMGPFYFSFFRNCYRSVFCVLLMLFRFNTIWCIRSLWIAAHMGVLFFGCDKSHFLERIYSFREVDLARSLQPKLFLMNFCSTF